MEKQEKVLTVEELALKLKVSPSWIYARTREKNSKMPFSRMGRLIRFEPKKIYSFFNLSENDGLSTDESLTKEIGATAA